MKKAWVEMTKFERLTALETMALSEGHTASYIAQRLRTTRNAVIGFAHRNAVQFGNGDHSATRRRAQYGETKSTPLKSTPRVKTVPSVGRPVPKPIAPPELREEFKAIAMSEPLPGSQPRALMECGRHECTWPVYTEGQPKLFCGQPVAAQKSYCAPHYNLAYRRPL